MFRAEELRLAQEAAQLAIWEWFVDTDELRWQPGSVELFSRPIAELTTGERFFECVSAADRERVKECVRDSVSSGKNYSVEFRVDLPGGETRWLVSNGCLAQERRPGQIMIGVSRDITDTKRREIKLRAQARLLDLAYEPILVRDPEDRIVYWNNGAELLYGYTWKEAKDRRSHELLDTKFPASLAEIESQLKATGSWEGELVHRTQSGHYIHVASRWRRFDADGSEFVLESNFDLSQRRALEIARAWEAKAKLLGEMAHEINNPLEAASGAAHILKASCDQQSAHYIEVLEQSIQRIAEFIRRSNELHRNPHLPRGLDGQRPVQ
ncbi:MAG: PAS domain-containing protein [Terriglobia bacterium]|nr:PAS domain-containing protein [Terriglobia bacterium]